MGTINSPPKKGSAPLLESAEKEARSAGINHTTANSASEQAILRITLSTLQALRFKPFLAAAKERGCAVGILATVCPRHDATSGETVLELRIGVFSRTMAHKIQKLLRKEASNENVE
jgi:hypothetical protein